MLSLFKLFVFVSFAPIFYKLLVRLDEKIVKIKVMTFTQTFFWKYPIGSKKCNFFEFFLDIPKKMCVNVKIKTHNFCSVF